MDPDAELVARIAGGSQAALEELYRRHAPRVFALLLRMLGSREEAEEVLQDSFFQLYKEARRYQKERGAVTTFLFTISRNLALSRLRARRARPQKDEGRDLHDPEQELGFTQNHDPEGRVMVRQALSRLSPEERLLLDEAFFMGYSHSDLAERHKMPLGTVKTKVRNALLRLHEFLGGKSVSDREEA